MILVYFKNNDYNLIRLCIVMKRKIYYQGCQRFEVLGFDIVSFMNVLVEVYIFLND